MRPINRYVTVCLLGALILWQYTTQSAMAQDQDPGAYVIETVSVSGDPRVGCKSGYDECVEVCTRNSMGECSERPRRQTAFAETVEEFESKKATK